MLFIDCEFNGHKGHLISMAIVSDKDDDEMYEVLHLPHSIEIVPWVQENVMVKLDKLAISERHFREVLHAYLDRHSGELIIADSPADFVYLMNMLHEITEDGKYRYYGEEVHMIFMPKSKCVPVNPHNALSDAKALRDWYINRRNSLPSVYDHKDEH